MRNKKLSLAILTACVIGAGASYLVYRQFASPTAGDVAGSVKYYCPMHPTYTSDRPGDCPI